LESPDADVLSQLCFEQPALSDPYQIDEVKSEVTSKASGSEELDEVTHKAKMGPKPPTALPPAHILQHLRQPEMFSKAKAAAPKAKHPHGTSEEPTPSQELRRRKQQTRKLADSSSGNDKDEKICKLDKKNKRKKATS